MSARLRHEAGQAAVLTVAFLTVLLGMTALAVDVGTWFHSKRDLQAVADSAALAGAQALPDDPTQARALAIDYGSRNGVTIPAGAISFSSQYVANDTINVQLDRAAPGFFSRVFGVGSVDVGAHASARTDAMSEAMYAAPIGVDLAHPLLSGSGCPCFGQQTTLDLTKTGPGAFRLLNLDGSKGGTGPGTLASWMLNGLNAWMPLGWYSSDPGAKFNASQMQSALNARIGSELLFPVYSATRGQGANFQYFVVGWVGFHLTGFDARGSSGQLYGWFTRVIWHGIQDTTGGTSSFGARAVQLVN
jgi:hypothetical protein